MPSAPRARSTCARIPGVRETLDALRARGLRVVGLTDAPRNAAELRLKHLKLDGHFDALYTLPGYPLPENVDPEIRRKEEAGLYRSRTPVIELPHDAEKPSPDRARADPVRLPASRRAEVLYVGDNVKKDMPVAEACGAIGVWAEYGTYVSAEYRERLAVISAKLGDAPPRRRRDGGALAARRSRASRRWPGSWTARAAAVARPRRRGKPRRSAGRPPRG